jgi:hypothetical protein
MVGARRLRFETVCGALGTDRPTSADGCQRESKLRRSGTIPYYLITFL